jgi:outer membrane protein X
MKKLFLSLVLLCTISVVAVNAQNAQNAQTFKPFSVAVSIGDAIPGGSGSKMGFLFAVEPRYALNDNLAVGLRIEGAVITKGLSGSNVSNNASAELNSSYTLTGDWYFNTNKFRPYAGLGLGLFSVQGGASTNNGQNGSSFSGTKFGAVPRIGFEYGHLRVALEYNAVGKSNLDGGGSASNSYLGIKIGVKIGGGRIKK